MSGERMAEQEQIREEKNSIEQCLAICASASAQAEQTRTNIFDDVSAAEDAHQLVVSTLGDLISAMRVSAGARSAQWLGQMSDASLQQLSRDRGHLAMGKAMEPHIGAVEKFEDQYGAGYKLRSGGLCSVPAE